LTDALLSVINQTFRHELNPSSVSLFSSWYALWRTCDYCRWSARPNIRRIANSSAAGEPKCEQFCHFTTG